MAISPLRVGGQVGTTIALGLLFDTLVVRSFMTPSIAALLGKWFWWPQTGASAAGSPAVAGATSGIQPDSTEQLSVGAGPPQDSP